MISNLLYKIKTFIKENESLHWPVVSMHMLHPADHVMSAVSKKQLLFIHTYLTSL